MASIIFFYFKIDFIIDKTISFLKNQQILKKNYKSQNNFIGKT